MAATLQVLHVRVLEDSGGEEKRRVITSFVLFTTHPGSVGVVMEMLESR